MMTSLVSDQPRGSREKVLPSTQATQKQIQATAEQIRLAQMIYDNNDAVFEDKVKQLMEVTGKGQDECVVALHDCNEDVNRAINFLLEGSTDTNSWETVGKKRTLGKEGSSSDKENKESREKEGNRSRGAANRRGRDVTRSREVHLEENGVDLPPVDRGSDRGRRARGKALAGRSRGRASGATKFSSQGMGTFNPSEYTTTNLSSAPAGSCPEECETAGPETGEGTGAWTVSQDDWAADDWIEDLSESKVFMASTTSADSQFSPGDSVDLGTVLQKRVESAETAAFPHTQTSSSQSVGQSLVFSTSQHTPHSAAARYAHAPLSSYLGSGFVNLGSSKVSQSGSIHAAEQPKSLGVTQGSPAVGGSDGAQLLSESSEGHVSEHTLSWDIKPLPSQRTTIQSSQFNRDVMKQPESLLVLGQRAEKQNFSSQACPASPPEGSSAFPNPQEASPAAKLTALTASVVPPPGGVAHQKHMKAQKRRAPPISKIPSSAVEMPGSADISGLNVQFGALDFGSEPSLPDFGQPENGTSRVSSANRESAPVTQTLNSLYSQSTNEHLGSPLSLGLSSSDSSQLSPAASLSSLASALAPPISAPPPSTSTGSGFEANGPLQSHLAFSQSKGSTTSAATNGFSDVRTTTLEMPSPSKPECPPQNCVTASTRTAAVSLTSSTSELPTHSSHVTSLLSSSSFTSTSVDSANPLSSQPPSSNSIVVSVNNTTHSTGGSVGAVGTLSLNGAAAPPASRNAPLLASSGKAPPNLAQGVPPLLPSQYIMGPGGLLPAYPIYGYEDLQMLQSRLPMDYYGMTFPAAASSLAGREGSLAGSAYSGEMTKFGRSDSASPAPPTSLSAPSAQQAQQPPQAQSQVQQQPGHHSAQQAFLNPALPPGYGYTGLPYYPGVPGLHSAFQYGPTMFVSPSSAKQHGVGASGPTALFQQPSAYTQHSYSSGFDEVTQSAAGGEYNKGTYSSSSQSHTKPPTSGPVKGVSVTSGTAAAADLGASGYSKAQSYDKQGFHGTPPPFSLPSALGGAGTLNPGAGPGYPPAPFLQILPTHQQPHSPLLHHHHAQDSQGAAGQRTQSSSLQQKAQTNKSPYSNSPYWAN